MHRWVSKTFSILTFLTCPSSARLSTSLCPFILSSSWSWCWVLPRVFSFYFEHPFECSCLVRWAPLLLAQLLLPGVRPNIGNQLSIMRNVEGWALATLEIIWEKKTLGCFPGQVLWGTSTSRQRWDWVFLHEQARLLPMTYLFLVWRRHILEVKSTILSLDHILSWCEDQERLIICNHLFPVDNRHWNLNLEDLKIHDEEEEHFPGKHLPSKSFLQGSCQWKASLSLTQAQSPADWAGVPTGKAKVIQSPPHICSDCTSSHCGSIFLCPLCLCCPYPLIHGAERWGRFSISAGAQIFLFLEGLKEMIMRMERGKPETHRCNGTRSHCPEIIMLVAAAEMLSLWDGILG